MHKHFRVLIVEDDKTSRLILRRILNSMEGVEVYEAEDGVIALSMLTSGLNPDLCFFDYSMPNMDGLTLLREVRNNVSIRTTKVCFCSAVKERARIIQVMMLQPDNYIIKPYDRKIIEAQIQKARGNPVPEESLEPKTTVCNRLGITPEVYEVQMSSFLMEVKAFTVKFPTLLMQLDIRGAVNALEHTKRIAQTLGLRKIYKHTEFLSTVIRAHSLMECCSETKEETAAHLQSWLGQHADHLMQKICEIQLELKALDSIRHNLTTGGTVIQTEISDILIALNGAVHRGTFITNQNTNKTKPFNIPIKTSVLGNNSSQTIGGVTKKTSFTLNIFDAQTAGALEQCRQNQDIIRNYSFTLANGDVWIPQAAVALLNHELQFRNNRGVQLLQQAVNQNLDQFLQIKASEIQTDLQQLNPVTATAQIQEILQTVKDRLLPGLNGELTAQVSFETTSNYILTDVMEDDKWANPFSLFTGCPELDDD